MPGLIGDPGGGPADPSQFSNDSTGGLGGGGASGSAAGQGIHPGVVAGTDALTPFLAASPPPAGPVGTFRQVGRIVAIINLINMCRGVEVPTVVSGLVGLLLPNADEADGLYRQLGQFQAAAGSLPSSLRSTAASLVVERQNSPTPLADPSLGSAIADLIARMKAGGMAVQACSVNVAVAAAPRSDGAANVGDVRWSVTPSLRDGRQAENSYTETVTLTCNADSSPGGGAAADRETFVAQGQPAVGDPLSPSWPQGSGASVAVTLIDADADQAGGTQNWLRNGSFEAWGAPGLTTPDGWHASGGVPGVQIVPSNTDLSGYFSMGFVGDGATLTGVYQELGVDSAVPITPLTQLAWNLWVRTDVPPAGGVLEVALVDAFGSVINDAAGTPNVATQDLSKMGSYGYGGYGSDGYGVGDGGNGYGQQGYGVGGYGGPAGPPFVPLDGFFRTPSALPTSVRFRIRLSVAVPAGTTVQIDRVALATPVSLYRQGPSVAAFVGPAPPSVGDRYQLNINNSSCGIMQRNWDRLFDMKGLGLLLPSSPTPNVAEPF